MPRVPNNQGLTNFLDFENMEALDKSQPLSFIISSDAEPPREGKFHMSSGIQENPPAPASPGLPFEAPSKKKAKEFFSRSQDLKS